jgi:hypothetical protein
VGPESVAAGMVSITPWIRAWKHIRGVESLDLIRSVIDTAILGKSVSPRCWPQHAHVLSLESHQRQPGEDRTTAHVEEECSLVVPKSTGNVIFILIRPIWSESAHLGIGLADIACMSGRRTVKSQSDLTLVRAVVDDLDIVSLLGGGCCLSRQSKEQQGEERGE